MMKLINLQYELHSVESIRKSHVRPLASDSLLTHDVTHPAKLLADLKASS